MKITNIECIPVQAPGRTLVPIIVETDEGITGIGEAGLQRRWHAIAGAVQHLRQWLIWRRPDADGAFVATYVPRWLLSWRQVDRLDDCGD